MNEQELIDKKIEEREKTDIIISYVMIVILVVCILFVAYLKLNNKEESNIVDNDTNNSDTTINEPVNLSLNELANTSSNRLNTKYNGIIISSNDNGLTITYGDINYELPLLNNELEFTIDSDNKELSEDIYRDLAAAICTYYTNELDNCNNASKSLNSSNSVTGVRFVGEDKVYIDIINNITPENNTSIDDTDEMSMSEPNPNGNVDNTNDTIELE